MSAHYAMCKYDDATGSYIPLSSVMAMDFDKWFTAYAPYAPESLDDCALAAYQAGAASRDAEIDDLGDSLAQVKLKNDLLIAERDQLRAKLAAALAACKVKDKALQSLVISGERSSFDCDAHQLYCEVKRTEVKKGRKALAIQPDDAALKAWLGPPVSYLYKHYSAFGDGVFWSHRPNHQGVAALETKALYSPKELK